MGRSKIDGKKMVRVPWSVGWTLSFLWVMVTSQAHGFAPQDKEAKPRSTYKAGAASFVRRPATSKVPAQKPVAHWEQFTQRYGDQWQVRWSGVTGTPERITGDGIATGLEPDSSDKSVETWARGFVEQNKQLLGVGPGDLRLLDLRRAGGRLHLTFHQVHDGLPVYNALLKLNINQEGDLVLISSSCFPGIEYDPTVKLLPDQAARMVADRISAKAKEADQSKFALVASEKVLFPVLGGKADPFRLCYRLKLHLNDPLGDWIVVVDASRGTEYARYNNYRFGTIYGNITGDILPAYEGDTPVSVPFARQAVHVFGETPVYSWDMSSNPGWSTAGGWAWGTPDGSGGSQGDNGPVSGHTGSTVYGYNLTGGYPNNLSTTFYLTTPPINCSSLTGTHVSFWQWLGIEMSYYDEVSFEVSRNGTNWITVWHNLFSMTKQSREWERGVFDISPIADGQSTVYLRWGLGPTDYTWNYAGWYIDDVAIYANGGTTVASGTGDYVFIYSGTGNEEVYAEMVGEFRNVYYEDGPRLAYANTVPSGSNSWSWTLPPLTAVESWNLDTNPGWTTSGAWQWGTPSGNEGDPASGHTGSNVYGYNLAGAYANNIGGTNYLTTTAINCSSYENTYLSFWRWLGVEAGIFDSANLEISNDGVNWLSLYQNPVFWSVMETEWSQAIYDISGVADGQSTVYIRWGMGPTDGSVTYCGWNIDDIEILADISGSSVKSSLRDFDEVTVFHQMDVVRNSILSIEPGFTGMDYNVPAAVRIDTDYPNAFWDGEGIYFGEGDGVYYGNFALFADVVYHEYNHGVTHQIYPEGMLPYTGESGALDEAWGDYFGCNITDEPLVGEGGLVIGEPFMRNLDNALRVPQDWAGEVHDDGRIVGGAMWDLREALGSVTASSLLHFARYNLAETFLDYYEDVLITDDDNSNLNDGTPHIGEIAAAFGIHGIGGLQVLASAQEVTEEYYNNGKLDAGETGNLLALLKAYFSPQNVQVTLGSPSPYVHVLDGSSDFGDFTYGQEKHNLSDPMTLRIGWGCPDDEILDLNLSITADGGFSMIWPLAIINAPDQILYDEGTASYYFGYGAQDGCFAVRFTPPRYPLTITSVRLWPSPYSPNVEIDLRAWDDDGPGGKPGTELMVPKTVQVTGSDSWEEFSVGSTQFETAYEWDMDTNPGWSTQGQWAFGTPTGGGGEYGYPDPTSGATGTNVYGYNLSGDYPNSMATTQYLTTGPIDCSARSNVYLQFQRWLGVESSTYDHASVEVSNNGPSWTTIWENTGEVADDQWRPVTYDISSVAAGESTVYIRWGMGPTDSSWRYCGWNIDDVKILEAVGTSGGILVESGDIYLGWTEKAETYYNGVTFANSDERSWVYDIDLSEWLQLDAEGYVMDILVRARYSQGAETGVSQWTSYE